MRRRGERTVAGTTTFASWTGAAAWGHHAHATTCCTPWPAGRHAELCDGGAASGKTLVPLIHVWRLAAKYHSLEAKTAPAGGAVRQAGCQDIICESELGPAVALVCRQQACGRQGAEPSLL